jgi:outer membrane protein assembly factor BamB
MRPTRSALAALAVFSLVVLAACNDRLFDNPYDPDAQTSAYEILATLQAGGIAPVDLAFSGDALWVVDAQSRLLALNYNSGEQIRELDVDQSPGGVAYDGNELWLSVQNTSRLVQVNPVNGAQLRVLNLLRGSFGPLDYANGRLYVSDRLTNAVLVVDPANGAIERSIAQPSFAIDGLCHDGSSIWILNASQMKFFRLDESGALENQYQAPSRTVAGLAYAEGIFWCGDQSGKIYKLRFP